MPQPFDIRVEWYKPYKLSEGIGPPSETTFPRTRGLYAWSVERQGKEYLCTLASSDRILDRQVELVSGLLGGVYEWRDFDGDRGAVRLPGTPEELSAADGFCHRVRVMLQDWRAWSPRANEFLGGVWVRLGELKRHEGFSIKQIEYVLLGHILRKAGRQPGGELITNINLRTARNPGEENPMVIRNEGAVPPFLDAEVHWPWR